MAKPSVIYIGPYKYKISFNQKYLDKLYLKDGDRCLGATDKDNLEIFVSPEPNVQIQRETLLHEILHACIGINPSSDSTSEEDIVVKCTPMLLMALRDRRNKKVWEFIYGKK